MLKSKGYKLYLFFFQLKHSLLAFAQMVFIMEFNTMDTVYIMRESLHDCWLLVFAVLNTDCFTTKIFCTELN